MCRTHQSREFWGAELTKLVDGRKIPGKAYQVTFWTMHNGDDQAISGNTFVPAKLIEIAKYCHTTYTYPLTNVYITDGKIFEILRKNSWFPWPCSVANCNKSEGTHLSRPRSTSLLTRADSSSQGHFIHPSQLVEESKGPRPLTAFRIENSKSGREFSYSVSPMNFIYSYNFIHFIPV